VDWAKRISTSDEWKVEKNKKTFKDCEIRGREKWKCGNKIVVCMDEFGKIDGEMGTTV